MDCPCLKKSTELWWFECGLVVSAVYWIRYHYDNHNHSSFVGSVTFCHPVCGGIKVSTFFCRCMWEFCLCPLWALPDGRLVPQCCAAAVPSTAPCRPTPTVHRPWLLPAHSDPRVQALSDPQRPSREGGRAEERPFLPQQRAGWVGVEVVQQHQTVWPIAGKKEFAHQNIGSCDLFMFSPAKTDRPCSNTQKWF